MANHLHPVMAQALAPFVQNLPSPEEIDQAVHQDKLNDGYAKRAQAQAMALQLQRDGMEQCFQRSSQ